MLARTLIQAGMDCVMALGNMITIYLGDICMLCM